MFPIAGCPGDAQPPASASDEVPAPKAEPISEELVAAAGFNLQNPIMNALMGNIKGTLPTKKSGVANAVRCDVCECEMSSDTVLQSHINGAKHKKKIKALEIVQQLKEKGEKGLELGKEDDPNAFRCELCQLTVNSAQQLEIHVSGAKHKNKAAKVGSSSSIPNATIFPDLSDMPNEATVISDPGVPPLKKKKKEEPQILSCDACGVILNSQMQYDQHMLSKKHLNKVTPPPQTMRKRRENERNFQSGNFHNKGTPNFNAGKFSKPLFNDRPQQSGFNQFTQFNPPHNQNKSFNKFYNFNNEHQHFRNNSFDNRNNSFESSNHSFDKKNQFFGNRNNSFENQNSGFENRNNSFENRNQNFQNTSNAFGNRNQTCQDRNNALGNRNQTFQNRNNNAFENRNQNFQNKNNSFENRNQNFQNKNNSFENRNQNFQNKNNAFENKNQTCQDRNDALGNRNQTFQNRNNAFENRNKSFGNRNSAFENSDNAFDNRNNASNFKNRNNLFENIPNGQFSRNKPDEGSRGQFNPQFGNFQTGPQKRKFDNFPNKAQQRFNNGNNMSQYAECNPSFFAGQNPVLNFALPPPPPPSS